MVSHLQQVIPAVGKAAPVRPNADDRAEYSEQEVQDEEDRGVTSVSASLCPDPDYGQARLNQAEGRCSRTGTLPHTDEAQRVGCAGADGYLAELNDLPHVRIRRWNPACTE